MSELDTLPVIYNSSQSAKNAVAAATTLEELFKAVKQILSTLIEVGAGFVAQIGKALILKKIFRA